MRLVVAAFSLGNVVLLYAYSGNLISYLTVPRMMPYPTEIVDIPRFPELRITLDYGSVLTKYFMVSLRCNLTLLREIFVVSNLLLVYEGGHGTKRQAVGRFAAPAPR